MGFTIQAGETRPVLDQNGVPITSASQHGLPYGPGLAAQMQDQGGVLVCVGNFASPTPIPFIVYGPGTSVQHEVTVEGLPFDWTLGDPA